WSRDRRWPGAGDGWPATSPWRARLLLDARVDGDPVHLPGPPAVIGVRLLEAARVRRDVGDHEAHEDGAAVERLLVVELAAAVLERADRRRAQGAGPDVGEVEAPLPRLGVVEPQADAFEVTGRPVGDQLHEVGPAVRDGPDDGRALVLDPGRRAGERLDEALQVRLPDTDVEIEVVLPVPKRRAAGLAAEEEGERQGESPLHHGRKLA